MSYIELINYFWAMDMEKKCSPIETRLYFILLNYANSARWKGKLNLSNNRMINEVGCSLTGFIKARKSLINKGFITYFQGNQHTAGTYIVHLNPSDDTRKIAKQTQCVSHKTSKSVFKSESNYSTPMSENSVRNNKENNEQSNVSSNKESRERSNKQSNIYKNRQEKNRQEIDEDEEEKIKKEEVQHHLLPHQRIIELFNEICVDLPKFDVSNRSYLRSLLHQRNKNLRT